MSRERDYLQFGLKYGIPLAIISATLAMKKSGGLGKLLTFSVVTPSMLAYLYPDKSKRKDKLEALKRVAYGKIKNQIAVSPVTVLQFEFRSPTLPFR